MYLISQTFIYLALALIIGGAIGYALRSCMADTACDGVREDLALANARYESVLESQSAAQVQHVVTLEPGSDVSTGFASLTAHDLEAILLKAAPGVTVKTRFGADDLTAIKGITPKIDVWLGLHGITRFSHIANLTAAELYWLVENLPQSGDSVYRHNWVAQATKLAR